MQLSPAQIALLVSVAVAVVSGLFVLDRAIPERGRPYLRIGVLVLAAAGLGLGVQMLAPSHEIGVDIIKGVIAAVAAGCVFLEAHRFSIGRPVSERWKRFAGIALGTAAILAYFNGLRFGYAHYYHRWDQYHYYMGAKYFPELGYDRLYRCSLIAQDEIGAYTYIDEDTGASSTLDMSREVRHPDKKIRNLGGDNLLKPAGEILAHPEQCKSHFSPERWEQYRKDVAFFRTTSEKPFWELMQKDHGFNPPPVWCLAGKLLSDLHPATQGYLQFLAALDILYLLGMFAALWWSFGWRVAAVAAIFWGCQSSAPYLWTGGSFLRQDWLFYMVLSACLLHKKYHAWGAAALVYAALLRIFPGLVVIGWLSVALFQLHRQRRLTRPQRRMLVGGTLAAAALVLASLQMCGSDSYRQFYEHTLKVHDETPLTNHMGLRVLIAQKTPFEIPSLDIGVGKESGRMKYTKDESETDPFKVWKDMRNERYARLKPLAYAIALLTLGLFGYVIRRIKSLWIAMCLAQIFCIVLAQLTCYYYAFMILGAPLTRAKPLRRPIELGLFGFVIVSQLTFRAFHWYDDRYWMLTLISLLFCYGLLAAFAPRMLSISTKEGGASKRAGTGIAT